jgi:hypothetical protein
MSDEGAAPDIELRRLNVADVPEADIRDGTRPAAAYCTG